MPYAGGKNPYKPGTLESLIWRSQQRTARRRQRDHEPSDTLDAVPSSLYKSAKLMGAVKTAVRTATQTQESRPMVAQASGACQESFSSIRRKEIPRSLTATLSNVPQRTYVTGDSGQLTIRDGAQEFLPIFDYLRNSDLIALPQVLGAAAGNRGAFIGGKAQIMLTNHSSAVMICMLYVTTPKVLTSKLPHTSFLDGAALSGDSDAYTNFGMRPGDSPYFRDLHRVRKVIKFCLGPGETHIHYHDYNVDKLLDDQDETYDSATDEYDPEWTVNFSLLVHGNAATSSTGGADTTTAGGQLNIVYMSRYRMKFFELAANVEDIVTNAGLPTKGSITERVYGLDSDAPANVNTGD